MGIDKQIKTRPDSENDILNKRSFPSKQILTSNNYLQYISSSAYAQKLDSLLRLENAVLNWGGGIVTIIDRINYISVNHQYLNSETQQLLLDINHYLNDLYLLLTSSISNSIK